MKTSRAYPFFAFVSYKRADERWARWLQGRLESYRLPASVRKAHPHLPAKIFPNFRDTTDIQPNPLEDELRHNLEKSRFLIVICSPRSAAVSPAGHVDWIDFEISHFCTLGRNENVILCIVDGEAYSANHPERECIHPTIKRLLPTLLGVNVHEKASFWPWVNRERAFIQIVSRMLDVSFDTLWQRQRRRMRNKAISYAALLLGMLGAGIMIWAQSQPFDMELRLDELTQHNECLPLVEESYIKLQFGQEWVQKDITSLNETLIFRDVAAKYKGEMIPVQMDCFGFSLPNPQVAAATDAVLPIARDDSYAKVRTWVGYVQDDGFKGVSGVQVTVGGQVLTTDADGFCEFSIELKEQGESYPVTINYSQQGQEQRMEEKAYPCKNDPHFINRYLLP